MSVEEKLELLLELLALADVSGASSLESEAEEELVEGPEEEEAGFGAHSG